jgi:hypothetical protein
MTKREEFAILSVFALSGLESIWQPSFWLL